MSKSTVKMTLLLRAYADELLMSTRHDESLEESWLLSDRFSFGDLGPDVLAVLRDDCRLFAKVAGKAIVGREVVAGRDLARHQLGFSPFLDRDCWPCFDGATLIDAAYHAGATALAVVDGRIVAERRDGSSDLGSEKDENGAVVERLANLHRVTRFADGEPRACDMLLVARNREALVLNVLPHLSDWMRVEPADRKVILYFPGLDRSGNARR